MGFKKERPEYYAGLTCFQESTDQQAQLQRLSGSFLRHLRQGLDRSLRSDGLSPALKSQLENALTKPVDWLDIGSGDGTMTEKLLHKFADTGIGVARYEGIEPDPHFRAVSQARLVGHPATIRDGEGFDGSLHQGGTRDLVTGFNSLYFADDLSALATDLHRTLAPMGMGIFIHNQSFTDNAAEAFTRARGWVARASIPTQVHFPPLSDRAWELITHRASEHRIETDGQLAQQDKTNAIRVKRIIDAMGGISTETEEGQKTAEKYRERILGADYGGPGNYISDNVMLVYLRPDAPTLFKEIVARAMKATRQEIGGQRGVG